MKPLVGFVALMLLLCSTVVFGQTESQSGFGYPALDAVSYNYGGGSARAMGMGYAFVGVANDVSGGIWNPAGLWILEGPMVSSSYSIYSPAGEFTHTLTDKITKNDIGLNAIGHFSFVAPVRIKGHPWVFNFNFNRDNEYSDEFDHVTLVSNRLNPDTFVEDQGYMSRFNVGASTRLYRQFSMGFTLNIITAKRFFDVQFNDLFDIIIDPTYGTTAELFFSDRRLDSISSNGFNFTIGTMMKGEKYSIGAVLHTPYTIKHSNDITSSTLVTLAGLVDVDNTSTIFVVDEVSKQDIPLSFAFGVGLFPSEDVTLSMDINYQNYGSTNWYYRTSMFFEPNGERTDTFEEIPIDWNNTIGLGFGAEYFLASKIGRIPLRAGFRFDQLPQPKEFDYFSTDVGYDSEMQPFQLAVPTLTRTATGRQTTTSFSLGSGIAWSRIELDFAYMYTGGASMKLENRIEYYFEDIDGNPQVGKTGSTFEWESKDHKFRFTFTGYF